MVKTKAEKTKTRTKEQVWKKRKCCYVSVYIADEAKKWLKQIMIMTAWRATGDVHFETGRTTVKRTRSARAEEKMNGPWVMMRQKYRAPKTKAKNKTKGKWRRVKIELRNDPEAGSRRRADKMWRSKIKTGNRSDRRTGKQKEGESKCTSRSTIAEKLMRKSCRRMMIVTRRMRRKWLRTDSGKSIESESDWTIENEKKRTKMNEASQFRAH